MSLLPIVGDSNNVWGYYDRTFYITTAAGTTTMAIQGGPTITLAASAAGQVVRVPAGKTLTPSYTNAPTWVVEGE